MSEVSALTVQALAGALASGERRARDVTQAFLDRVERYEGLLHAFQTVDNERALTRADALDRAHAASGPVGPLHGVPIALKDNLSTCGLETTAASRILKGFTPPFNATVVDRLERAGAIMIGKTNLDEFAMGSSTENSAFGASRNPWATDRTPGGSSGGSAVAVAARFAPAALGSDTGGSIRQPAALTGVVGLKPTYGRVSRFGLLAFASSLDQIGPLTQTAADAALLLEVIAGADDRDATASRQSVEPYLAALDGAVHDLRVGVPRAMLETGVDEDVRRAFEASLEILRARGARVIDIELPHARYAVPVYYLIATAEASSNLARYDGVRYGFRAPVASGVTSASGRGRGQPAALQTMYERTRDEGFGAEVKRRIMLGTYVLSAGYYDAYYLKAQQVRTLLAQDYTAAFADVEAIALPTTPTPAFRLGEKLDDPLQMYLADIFTVSANLAGLPAISVPCGFSGDRLPLGLQLTGRPFDEGRLLKLADAFQRDTDHHRQRPAL